MQMYLGGAWVDRPDWIEVRNPYTREVFDTVPAATGEDVETALATAQAAAAEMARLPAYDRSRILERAAQLLGERTEIFARGISCEAGKTLAEARFEVGRAVETCRLSAEEGRRLTGEMLPIEGSPGGAGKLGFTLRVPCGVVAAITPFNFPLNLVCHKVAPALAAGNAVILKPASTTPTTALRLVEVLLEAGLPARAIQCLTGSGKTLGEAICRDARVRKISFTGSRDVGERIIQAAGIKRVTLELGSNSPVIVLADGDLEAATRALAVAGYSNAGQVCISAQRVIVERAVYGDFVEQLAARVAAIRVGDPLAEGTQMGPMIDPQEAIRVRAWIDEAVAAGGRVVCGGGHDAALFEPTVVADVDPRSKLSREELFGPALAVTPVDSLDAALEHAADTRYGLSAAIFTRSIDRALRFIREVPAGNLHVNAGPNFRADFMPYGGLKESGLGKEGPRYALLEMTEAKTVIWH